MELPLRLKDATPLAKGGSRLVFGHPDHPNLLVKVLRPDGVMRARKSVFTPLAHLRRYDPYLVYLREIREYISGCAGPGGSPRFLEKVRGLVETDLGLGLVTEAALDEQGRLAPTLAQLISDGKFHGEAEEAFERFAEDLLGCDVVISDLHERNLVYAMGRDGRKSFWLIDGLGSSALLPFKNWSHWLNDRSKRKRIARLRRRMVRRLETVPGARDQG